MIKVLFICYGNICRSPMAEFILKSMVVEQGLAEGFEIASAATSREEIGNPVYPPTRRELARHEISCEGKRARQVTRADYDKYDFFLAAERYNVAQLRRLLPADTEGKLYRLLDFAEQPGDISDPWYHGDFARTYREIEEGCAAFLRWLQRSGRLCPADLEKI